MERFEVYFDRERPYHRTKHARGIETLMVVRGPPKLDDELDVQLAIENHAALLSLWVVEGGNNFYLSPDVKRG